MKLNPVHQITKAAVSVLILAVTSGCAAMKYLPYNYMCDPTHAACQNANCNHQLTAHNSVLADPLIANTAAADPMVELRAYESELSAIRKQLQSVTDENSRIQTQLITLDKNDVEQSLNHDKITTAMNNVVEDITAVRSDLAQQRSEISNVEGRMTRYRDQTRQMLSNVDQELTGVLTEFEHQATTP